MSISSPNLDRRERAIEAARRRLRRLEIETHRIKADLARLEADYEDDVADVLTYRLRRRRRGDQPLPDDKTEPASSTTIFASAISQNEPVVSLSQPHSDEQPSTIVVRARKRMSHDGSLNTLPTAAARVTTGCAKLPDLPWRQRRAAGPLACSFAIHAVALLFCLSFTFVTLIQQEVPLLASPIALEEDIPGPSNDVKIEPAIFTDSELQNTHAVVEKFNVADQASVELELAEIGAGIEALGEIGQLDALPSDLATLMAGAGKPGNGKPGGEIGNAVFFGAHSKGNRFAFVIDNSSSMKGNRLDAARAELIRTLEDLSPKQSFYIIFVSDQTYPMFFPRPELDMVPATAANIKHVAAWLPNAMLASGKNRELIKAMDMAATLRPDAVYLLWDGDLKYSDAVRRDVMTHLTAANQWEFVVHTIGFDIRSLDNEQNLTTIAQAHGGVYRRIDLPRLRTK